MVLEHIEIKKVSPFVLRELVRVINVFATSLTTPTNTNKFKFDLAKQLYLYFNKKVNKQHVPTKQKLKLKVFEAIFLLEIITTVAEQEQKPGTLFTIVDTINQQLQQ